MFISEWASGVEQLDIKTVTTLSICYVLVSTWEEIEN